MIPAGQRPRGGRRRVAVLGATGAVGQAFVRLLDDHPWFDLVEVAASERSAGKRYADAVRWIGDDPLPERAASLEVLACDPRSVSADIVFSALDSSVAGGVEASFARAGRHVLTNAKNYRMEPDVPLVIAEVNPAHLAVLQSQRARRGWSGSIVANGNCAAIVAALALAPLHERFGITKLFVSTMQAVSGAGYPGVPSLDIIGNVVPFIKEEEDKIEQEVRKFLGDVTGDVIRPAAIVVSAHANRVPVEHGHTMCLSVALRTPATVADAERALDDWCGAEVARTLPSSPVRPVVRVGVEDRPQPRRDVNEGEGMSVVVGRVRKDPLLDVKLVAMGHNIIRGAAGASILNAELLVDGGQLAPGGA